MPSKKKGPVQTDSTIPIFDLEDIEEGVEGKKNTVLVQTHPIIYSSLMVIIFHQYVSVQFVCLIN